MSKFILIRALLLSAFHVYTVESEYTNLPDVPPGIFQVGTRIEIHGTTTAAWDALTNFPNYPDWNPFVRYAAVVSPLNITLPDQYPVEGKQLFLTTQIPPLPLPVNKDTPGNLLHTQFAYENVTHVQPELGRLSWVYVGKVLIEAERWQAVSDIGNGITLYESREVFNGLLATTLKKLLGEALQESFDAQGKALKLLVEG